MNVQGYKIPDHLSNMEIFVTSSFEKRKMFFAFISLRIRRYMKANPTHVVELQTNPYKPHIVRIVDQTSQEVVYLLEGMSDETEDILSDIAAFEPAPPTIVVLSLSTLTCFAFPS